MAFAFVKFNRSVLSVLDSFNQSFLFLRTIGGISVSWLALFAQGLIVLAGFVGVVGATVMVVAGALLLEVLLMLYSFTFVFTFDLLAVLFVSGVAVSSI